MRRSRYATALAGVAGLALLAPAAHASTASGLLLEFTESNGSIAVELSGTIALPFETSSDFVSGEPQVDPDAGVILGYADVDIIPLSEPGGLQPREVIVGQFFDLYTLSEGTPFGSGGTAAPLLDWSGDAIYLSFGNGGNRLGLLPEFLFAMIDDDFMLRSLSATATMNTTFDSLGIDEGSSFFSVTGPTEFTFGTTRNDPPPDIEIRFTRAEQPGVIPLPGALPLLLGGLGLFGLVAARRRRG